MSYRQLSFAIYANGIFLLALAAAMLVPMIVDFSTGNPDDTTFLISAALTASVGGLCFTAFRRSWAGPLDRRTGFLLTVSSWFVVSMFGSVPLLLSTLQLSFTDAVFETVSGLTTTGATVLSGLDTMAPGLLLWRSLLQWIGGVGIVVMAIALLPMMRVGGMQLFQSESSDISGKPFSRINQLARATATAYVGLTLACAAALMAAGMGPFDAINHAMATIATGGFSTRDASAGFYDSVPIECVLMVFMAMSALPLLFYVDMLIRGRTAFLEEQQVLAFLKVLAVAIALATVWNVSRGMQPGHALRVSAFNVTSILTDTGFATADFSRWGGFAIGLFFTLYFIGGCAGSTSGAVKIFRWQLLFAGARDHLKSLLSPSRVSVLKYKDKPVDDQTLSDVRNFLFMYLVTFVVLSLLVMATGLDFLSATSSIAQGMANAGPGLGPLVGPASNFRSVPEAAKWLVIVSMVLGRLELATVYVFLIPDYWRD